MVPAIPKKASQPSSNTTIGQKKVEEPVIDATQEVAVDDNAQIENGEFKSAEPAATGAPKSWANLFKGTASASVSTTNAPNTNVSQSDLAGGFSKSNNESLAAALFSYSATKVDGKFSFLEPRGLVNTGNMCYMNSVSRDSRYHPDFSC